MVRMNKESHCIVCEKTFENTRKTKEHLLAEHYDFCLSQCNGDKEFLKMWILSKDKTFD